jgi:hypothetical protein
MPSTDYRRFMNFLAAHECTVDFRQFRTLSPIDAPPRPIHLPIDVAAPKKAPRRASTP